MFLVKLHRAFTYNVFGKTSRFPSPSFLYLSPLTPASLGCRFSLIGLKQLDILCNGEYYQCKHVLSYFSNKHSYYEHLL